jgi:glycosyltransferase involved in cell wall biosynthesis
MIIEDDGSTDETVSIARSFRDSRVRVVENAHRGMMRLAETYQAGVNASTGDLVAVLEGDDSWPANKLEEQLPQFSEPSVVLAYGAAELIDELGCHYATYRRRVRHHLNRPAGSILPALLSQNFIVASTVIVRREALKQIGGFWQPASIPYVDHPTWLRLAQVGTFSYSETPVGRWRRHARQWTTAEATAAVLDRVTYLSEVGQALPDKGWNVRGERERLNQLRLLADLRLALLHGDRRRSQSAVRELLATRKPQLVALALIGATQPLLGGDLEWIFRSSGRFSWPSRRHTLHHVRTQAGASKNDAQQKQ